MGKVGLVRGMYEAPFTVDKGRAALAGLGLLLNEITVSQFGDLLLDEITVSQSVVDT